VEKNGSYLPVVEASCAYRRPARYDDVLIVRAEIAEMRGASLTFSYELRREGEDRVLCTGKTVHACIKEGKPTRIPESVAAMFEEKRNG